MHFRAPLIAALLLAVASTATFAAGTADHQVTQSDRHAEAGGTNDNYGTSGVEVEDNFSQSDRPAATQAANNARASFGDRSNVSVDSMSNRRDSMPNDNDM